MPVATAYGVGVRGTPKEYVIHTRVCEGKTKSGAIVTHEYQKKIRTSSAKRLSIKAGRRGAKTVSLAGKGIDSFIGIDYWGNLRKPKRVLYLAPTAMQTDAFWFEVCRALKEPLDSKVLKINSSEKYIEFPGTQRRIKAKTAWNADTARGDYADLLLIDEQQLMNESVWDEVGAPMLLDNNGDAVFAFTPSSLKSEGISKARDPRWASKMFKKALLDKSGLWETIHFTSHDNPFISREGLKIITQDMSLDSYRREIMAEDDEIETSWMVYGLFNESACKRKREPIPKEWPVYSFHDFGPSNPAALFLAQNPKNGEITIFKEYKPGAGFSTADHVLQFKKITDGMNFKMARGGNVTSEDEIRQGYGAHGWPISPPVIKDVKAQLDRAIGWIESDKIIIFDDLFNLLSEIASCMWILDDENKPTVGKIKDEHKYHLLSAFRVGMTHFTPETQYHSNQKVVCRSYLKQGFKEWQKKL